MQTVIGFILGAIIAFLAWRARSLSRSGAWAAALTGGLVFGLGGLAWAAVLLTFFISSSALSRMFARRKARVEEKYAKGSQRDWGQVLANGGLGALLAVANWLLPDQSWPWLAFTGAMAAVTADTWATELGIFNPTPPRLITNGKVVERGTSGGVTLLGYLAVLGGAALVGVVAAIFYPDQALVLIVGSIAGGLTGSTVELDTWRDLASDLLLPGLPERNRAPSQSFLWNPHDPTSWFALDEQRLGELFVLGNRGCASPGCMGTL